MPAATGLISGDELKAAAFKYAGEIRLRVKDDQGGLLSIFDGWFARTVSCLLQFDQARSWEESVRERAAHAPPAVDLRWDLLRLRQFLDRWRRGRFVTFAERQRTAVFYDQRLGTEFGIDVLLMSQGAPSLLRWRGTPLMKNVFDFAMYPALISELRPLTVFEIGSGLGQARRGLPTR